MPDAHKIVGMRNILIHGYAEVNDLTVWRTATGNLAGVLTANEALLQDIGPPPTPPGKA